MNAPSAFALLGLVLLAFGLRSLGLENVFLASGEVVLAYDDPPCHARRALFTFVNFPALLRFDPYMAFPHGATSPWPPGFDFALAAVARFLARLSGDGAAAFERVLAWSPPILGALATVGVYAGARQLGTRALALGAAGIFAVLPVTVDYARVGRPDHHVAVVFLGAAWLALALAGTRDDARGARLGLLQAGLVVVRVAMVLTWHGSLLYIGLAEGASLLAALATGRRDLRVAQAVGCLAAAAALLPALRVAGAHPLPLLSFSILQPLALVAVAGVAAVGAAWDRLRPTVRMGARLLRSGALAVAASLILLGLPDVRDGIFWVLGYLLEQESFVASNFETGSLFESGLGEALATWGFFAIALPLAPLASIAIARRERAPAFCLLVWTAGFGALAVGNARYGNDAAPAVSIAFAFGVAWLVGRVARGPRLRVALGVVVGMALLAPTVPRVAMRVPGAWAFSTGGVGGESQAPRRWFVRGLHEFALGVRAATPETAGFLDDGRPEYGVIAFPSIGCLVQYTARRPTPADNIGPYLDPVLGPLSRALTVDFYSARSEDAAVAIAGRLRARYAITSDVARPRPEALLHRLHHADGAGSRPLRRFRLVTEGPRRGVPLGALGGSAPGVVASPWKLFEIVPGAVLVARATPGTTFTAEVELEAPTGRRFVWSDSSKSGADGVARLRVPYASGGREPVRARGPYRVRVGDREGTIVVDDEAVRSGAEVPVE